jgi:predicted nucleic acid-binding protein
MRTLSQIPSGSKVFVDANIFVYHFGSDGDISDACTEFLLRVEEREVEASTSTIILSEVLHRLMIVEAVEKYRLPLRGIVRYLKEHPDVVMTLEKYSVAPEKIRQMSVAISAIMIQDLLDSKGVRDSYGLLTNDSTSVSIMKRFGIADIATNDSDFERVNGLRVWKPLA